jgi:hypothetical protein
MTLTAQKLSDLKAMAASREFYQTRDGIVTLSVSTETITALVERIEKLSRLLASSRRYVEYGAEFGMSLGARYAQDLLAEIDALS